MAAAGVHLEEQQARAALRRQRKATAASRAAAERRRRDRERAAVRRRAWIEREKAAYLAQLADPAKHGAWLAVWREPGAVL